MFDFLRKNRREAKLDFKAIEEQSKVYKETQEFFNNFFKGYSVKIFNALDEIKLLSAENQNWSKEFHRLLLNEYARYPQNRIYGLVYLNSKNNQRRLMLVSALTLEQSMATSEVILVKEGENSKDWYVEGFQSLDLPITEETPIDRVDKKMEDVNKPHGVFVNDLLLVKDRYASSETERKVIDKIIKKIESVH